MLPGFEQVVRPYIPVVAHVKQRVKPIITPKPEVGIRWGKPSRFEFDELDSKNEDEAGEEPVFVEYLHDSETITGEEVYRQWDKVSVEAVNDPSISFEFERPRELYFLTHETKVHEDVVKDTSTEYVKFIQPEITTTFHYIKFSFPLSDPEDTVIESGERGEHPDITLKKTIAKRTPIQQQIQEYWEAVFENI